MLQQQESKSYCRAAIFANERLAGKAYLQIQDLIFGTQCDISAYRFKINDVFHVAVVGDTPDEELDSQLQKALTHGETVCLEEPMLDFLQRRRATQQERGPWVEAHYRPGRRFSFGRE